MSSFLESSKNHFSKYSLLQHFFSKEIKEINYGICVQFYCLPSSCRHPIIKITYEDESIKYFFNVSGYDLYHLCKEQNKELPEHFNYMKYNKHLCI